MQRRPPRFLYFDMGNVLLRFSHQRMAEQMAALTGIEPGQAWKFLFHQPDGIEWAFERGELTREGFYERFCEMAGSRADLSALDQAANDIFELNVPIVGLVGKLFGAGYPLGVFSNTTPTHWGFCRQRFGILRTMFSVPAMSYDFCSMKPAAEAYEKAASLAGYSPSEIFFTDDRLENVEGAIAAGWDAVQFTSVPQLNQELRKRGISLNY